MIEVTKLMINLIAGGANMPKNRPESSSSVQRCMVIEVFTMAGLIKPIRMTMSIPVSPITENIGYHRHAMMVGIHPPNSLPISLLLELIHSKMVMLKLQTNGSAAPAMKAWFSACAVAMSGA